MKTTKKVTISAQIADHSLIGLRRSEIDTESLLHRAGIDPDSLKTPGARLPVEQVVKLHFFSILQSRDELVQLLHKPMPLGLFRLVALGVIHCKTLGQAIQRYIEYLNIIGNSFQYELKTKGSRSEFVMKRIPEHQIASDYAIDSMLSIHHRFLGWLSNERIIPNQVKLDFAPPAYRDEYPYMYYGAPVLFNQARISMSFDRQYLDHPVVQNESSLASYLRRAPLDLFLPLDAGGETTLDVRKCLLDHFGEHDTILDLDQLSEILKIHPQTLRRHLRSENTSFNAIKSQVRRDIAIHFLGKDDISIETVAEKSGYAETGAFIRAFKGWTGFTPLQFRKGLDVSA